MFIQCQVSCVSIFGSMENRRTKRRKITCCKYAKGEQTFNVVFIHNTRQTVKDGWTANWMDSIILYRPALHSVFSYWVHSNPHQQINFTRAQSKDYKLAPLTVSYGPLLRLMKDFNCFCFNAQFCSVYINRTV